MRCGELETLIDFYLDGDLDDDRSAEVRDHLQGCASCRATYQPMLTLLYQPVEVQLPGDLADRVKQAVAKVSPPAKAANGGGQHRSWSPGAWWMPISALAASLVLFVAGWLASSLWQKPAPQVIVVEKESAAQAEPVQVVLSPELLSGYLQSLAASAPNHPLAPAIQALAIEQMLAQAQWPESDDNVGLPRRRITEQLPPAPPQEQEQETGFYVPGLIPPLPVQRL